MRCFRTRFHLVLIAILAVFTMGAMVEPAYGKSHGNSDNKSHKKWKNNTPPGQMKKADDFKKGYDYKKDDYHTKVVVPYTYYPDYQAYRNDENGKYFWLEDGKWKIGFNLPEWIHSRNARRERIGLYEITPFASHQELARRFPPDNRVSRNVYRHQGPPDHAPAWGWRRKHGRTYDFYPEQEVWYDRTYKQYIWLEAGKWKIGVELPKTIKIDLKKVVPFDF